MPYSRHQVQVVVSIVYLLIVTAIGSYATYDIQNYNLPIPSTLSGFTLILPIIAGVTLETSRAKSRSVAHKRSIEGQYSISSLTLVVLSVLTIYETTVAALAGTYISPQNGLTCGLDGQWMRMFQVKDSTTVRRIQSAFQCCGLHSPKDKAWPFPDKSHTGMACVKSFGYTKGCFESWKNEERSAAGMLLAVAVLTFLWQTAVMSIPEGRPAWLHRVLPNQITNLIAEGDHDPRRQIEYQPNQGQYTDQPRVEEQNEPDPVPRANGQVEGNGLGSQTGHEVAEERNEWRR